MGLALLLLTAHTSAAQVTLAWSASPSAGVDGYRLHYGTQSRNYTASFDAGTATTYTVTGLTHGQTYYFAVTAYDTTDSTESIFSNEASTTLPPDGEPGGLITIEAEAMTLTGYLVESNTEAGGGALISRSGATGAPPGLAQAAFPGPAGTYDIIVTYFDENDGQSTLALAVNGTAVDTWVANADLPSTLPNATTLAYREAATGYPLEPGDVILLQGSENVGEFARIDRVEFVPVDSVMEVIVDNQDPNTTPTGTWQVSNGANPWDGESLHSTTTKDRFRWTPQLPAAGTYQVYAWWTYTSVRATRVPYKIRHQSGTSTVIVNQRDVALGGRWNLLGTFTFAAGSAGWVTVSGQNGNACADAVRFVKQ